VASLLVYWLLFAFFAVGTLLSAGEQASPRGRTPVLLMFGATLVCLAIGLRYQVGADWETYKLLYSYAGLVKLGRVLSFGDPAYQILSWSIQRTGAEIWALNLICALIFTWGLHRFARAQPDPWLAFAVAVPYLIIVVAMGYTRQAVAIGILMAGLASIHRGASVLRFAVYVAGAALFHKTAVVVLPLVIFAGRRNRALNALAGIAACVLLYDLLLSQSVEGFVRNYIQAEYSSQGAAIRVAMNLVPATLFLMFHQRLRFDAEQANIWKYFSLASFLMPVLLLVLPSSTAVDRMALYLIPLQIAVLPRIQYLFKTPRAGRTLVILYSMAVMFTWLNFAAHARYWVPYRFYPGMLD
jgi:hypothetical protein